MQQSLRKHAITIGATAGIFGATVGVALGLSGAGSVPVLLAGSTGATSAVSDSTVTSTTTTSLGTAPAGLDMSGPCDEPEHADDPRCRSEAVDRSVTPTTVGNGATPTSSARRSVDAAGAGTVVYTVSGSTFQLVSATPADGWRVEIERAVGFEIDLDFRSGDRRVQVDIEFEDGGVRERVRLRDDAADTRVETTNGVITDVRADDDRDDLDDSGREDRSGSGHSGSEDDHERDDNRDRDDDRDRDEDDRSDRDDD